MQGAQEWWDLLLEGWSRLLYTKSWQNTEEAEQLSGAGFIYKAEYTFPLFQQVAQLLCLYQKATTWVLGNMHAHTHTQDRRPV